MEIIFLVCITHSYFNVNYMNITTAESDFRYTVVTNDPDLSSILSAGAKI